VTNLYIFKKTLIIDEGNNDSLFFFFNHFIFFAVYDNAFKIIYAKNVENIFRVKIPSGKKNLTLK